MIRTMIEVKKDKKSPTWIITHTDSEGFHKQLQKTREDIKELLHKIISVLFIEGSKQINGYVCKIREEEGLWQATTEKH